MHAGTMGVSCSAHLVPTLSRTSTHPRCQALQVRLVRGVELPPLHKLQPLPLERHKRGHFDHRQLRVGADDGACAFHPAAETGTGHGGGVGSVSGLRPLEVWSRVSGAASIAPPCPVRPWARGAASACDHDSVWVRNHARRRRLRNEWLLDVPVRAEGGLGGMLNAGGRHSASTVVLWTALHCTAWEQPHSGSTRASTTLSSARTSELDRDVKLALRHPHALLVVSGTAAHPHTQSALFRHERRS